MYEETGDPKALVRRWFEEVWNKGREEAIDEMFAEDGVAHGLATGRVCGRFWSASAAVVAAAETIRPRAMTPARHCHRAR